MNVILLPGIIAPARFRYAPLLTHLPGVRALAKELEVYAGPTPPESSYSIDVEIDGVDRAARRETSTVTARIPAAPPRSDMDASK